MVNVHNAQGKKIITIVDSQLIGKHFEQGRRQLDMASNFYKGEEMPESKIKQIVPSAYIVHIVGKESIAFAQREHIIGKGMKMITIAGIPHAEIVF